MSSSPVIDPQAIENLRSLNPGNNDVFLKELTIIFLEDTPQRIADLDQSLVAGDTARFTRAAHSIKGSSANMGAMLLRAAAEKLEHHSRQNGLKDVDTLVTAVREEFARAKVDLEKLIGRA